MDDDYFLVMDDEAYMVVNDSKPHKIFPAYTQPPLHLITEILIGGKVI